MGRNKLKIEKLSTNEGRQVTYSKRKGGIMKKAKELSVLCDVDVLPLAFSNTGKASLCLGENSFEDIIEKYANTSPQQRKKKKSEGLEGLKKTFKKDDHEVDVDQFLDQGSPRVEDLQKLVETFKKQINETYHWLGPVGWLTELENIENREAVSLLEDTLKGMITDNQIQKEQYAEKVIDLRYTDNELDQYDEPLLYQNVLNQQLDQNDESLLFNFNDSQQIPRPQNILHESSLNAGLDKHAILEKQNGSLPQEDFGQVFPETFTEINALTKEVQESLNQSSAHQEQTNNHDNLFEPGEKQYTVPQTNASNNKPGDFHSLPEGCISDNEFVNNLLDQNCITFDGLHDQDLTLPNPNTVLNVNPNADRLW